MFGCGDTLESATADHDRKMHDLLARCRERGIRLNKDKFRLRRDTVPYMGHLLTPEWIENRPSQGGSGTKDAAAGRQERSTMLDWFNYLSLEIY